MFGHTVRFDLYLYEPERSYKEQQYLQPMMGSEVPRVGDLLELNETNYHFKYEVVKVHRFYTPSVEVREPRVYVKRVDA